MAVVLFHTQIAWLPGGFTGVDIFYVISGYLITRIIFEKCTSGTLSFAYFYAKRAKRLFPAALVTILIVISVSFFVLTPGKYNELAKSAFMSSLFSANIWFAMNSGYFDQSTDIAPLAHMWSLAVEEQFYLAVPFIIAIFYRFFGKKGVILSLSFIMATSLMLSILLSAKYPDTSFYLIHTRAWELCAGGILGVATNRKQLDIRYQSTFALIGFVLIGYSFVFISSTNVFPGYLALMPVIGTLLLIATINKPKTLGYNLLCSKPVTFIGKISYSTYLWHWPVIVFYRIYISERHFTGIEKILLIIVSLTFGYISYVMIENRFRYIKSTNKITFKRTAAVVLFVTSISFLIYRFDGFPNRISETAQSLTALHSMHKYPCNEKIKPFSGSNEKFCVIGADWETSIRSVIWGDSHSLHFTPMFDRYLKRKQVAMLVAPLQCPPYLDGKIAFENYPKFPNFTEVCAVKYKEMLTLLGEKNDIRYVVLASAWSGHIKQLYNNENQYNLMTNSMYSDGSDESGHPVMAAAIKGLAEKLSKQNKDVLIIGDIPRNETGINIAECEFNNLNELLRDECAQGYDTLKASYVRKWHSSSEAILREVADNYDRFVFFSFVDYLCSDRVCTTKINDEVIYRDSNHLRQSLNAQTLEKLSEALQLDDFFQHGARH